MTFPPLIIWAFLVQKSDFCHTTPILVDDPFLALGMTVNFPPWKPFFDFPFRSYSCFRKKNSADGSKSLPPSHCRSSVCLRARAGLIISVFGQSNYTNTLIFQAAPWLPALLLPLVLPCTSPQSTSPTHQLETQA